MSFRAYRSKTNPSDVIRAHHSKKGDWIIARDDGLPYFTVSNWYFRHTYEETRRRPNTRSSSSKPSRVHRSRRRCSRDLHANSRLERSAVAARK